MRIEKERESGQDRGNKKGMEDKREMNGEREMRKR